MKALGRAASWIFPLVLWPAAFLAASRSVRAGEPRSAAQALILPFTSRSTGLNGAFAAVPGGLSSLNFNAAGLFVLSKAKASQSSLLFAPVSGASREEAAGYGRPIGKAVIAAGVLEYDDAQAATSPGVAAKNASTAILDLAFPLGGGVWGGVQARSLYADSFQNGDAYGFDTGAGLLWDSPVKGLSLGASLQNAGPALQFQAEKVDLPETARAGAAYAWRYPFGIPLLLLATADGVKPRGGEFGEISGLQVTAESERGLQTSVEGGLALAGEPRSASLGVGFAWKARWTLDYSLTLANGGFGPLNTVTLGYRFFGKATNR